MVSANANGSYEDQLSTITKHNFLRSPQDNNNPMKSEIRPVFKCFVYVGNVGTSVT